jgi:hypothetical protein
MLSQIKKTQGVFKDVATSIPISNQFTADLIAVYEFGLYLKTLGRLDNQETF